VITGKKSNQQVMSEDPPTRRRARTPNILSSSTSSAPPTTPPSPHARRRTAMALGMASTSAQALFNSISNSTAMHWSGAQHSVSANCSPAADTPAHKDSDSPTKRFMHRRSVSQSEAINNNGADAGFPKRRKSFRAQRLSVFAKAKIEEQKVETSDLSLDHVELAITEIQRLVQERNDDPELCSRLKTISNLLDSSIYETSMNRAEQIEKAMVAEVLDYESNDLMPQAHMFANWVSRRKLIQFMRLQLKLSE
jgi:hypothetical protein